MTKPTTQEIEAVAIAMWAHAMEGQKARGGTVTKWKKVTPTFARFFRAAAEWAITHGAQP